MSVRPTTPSFSRRGALQVAPAAVEFDSVEHGACFVASLSVRNASNRPLRFRLVPPGHASPFKVLSRAGRDLARTANPTVQLPAGLAERFDVAFELSDAEKSVGAAHSDDVGSPAIFHDMLLVKGEDDSVVQVPLVAKRAGPRLEMEPAQLDFGLLVHGQRSAQFVEIKNTGVRPGVFELEVLAASSDGAGGANPITSVSDGSTSSRLTASASASTALVVASPRRGQLGPQERINVQIDATGTAVGGFRVLIRVRIWESCRGDGSPQRNEDNNDDDGFDTGGDVGGQPRSARYCAEKLVDASGTVVEHTVELVLHRGFEPVRGLHFGSLFAGEHKSIETLLRNNGPLPLHFKVSVSFGGGLAGASASVSSDEDRAMFERKKELSVAPVEGRIEPFGTLPVVFSYRPRAVDFEKMQILERKHCQGTGDSPSGDVDEESTNAAHQLLIPPELLSAFASIQCTDLQGQNLTFEISGKKFLPRLSLTPSAAATSSTQPFVFDFGDVKSHDRADMIVTMKNLSGLPIQFSIPKLAHFSARPMDGRLDVLQSQNVVLSFTPTQLGSFRSTMKLFVCKDVLAIPISVLGRAAAVGDTNTRPIIGGTEALPKDFAPQYKFLLPEEAKRTKGQFEKKFQRLPPYEVAALNGTAAVDEYEFEGTNNTHLTYCVKELSRRADHKASYHEYLAKCRVQRQQQSGKHRTQSSALDLKANIARARSGGDDNGEGELAYEDVNLGMNSQAGIEPKSLRLPPSLRRTSDPLWLRESSTGSSGASPAKAFFDENKLVKKKFKPHPATQAELADCALTLDFDQLEMITSGPKTINYGKISVNGVATKNLTVQNNLAQNILVRLHLQEQDNMPELTGKTTLKSQVVPPRSVAGFDLTFASSKEQFFQKELTYSINDVHTRQVTLVAEVAPIEVEVSDSELLFEFSAVDLNPSMVREIMLANTSDSVAPFEWSSQASLSPTSARPDSSKSNKTTATTAPTASEKTSNGSSASVSPTFTIVPASGIMDPADTRECKIVFTPPPSASSASAFSPHMRVDRSGDCTILTQTFQLKVVGGKPASVTCKAVVRDLKVAVKEKKIDFGTLSAGVERIKKLTLTNQSRGADSSCGVGSTAVYYASIDPPSLASSIGLSVSPATGAIPCDETIELSVSILAHRTVTLETTANVVVQIRGGKTFRVPIVADVIIPDVHVVPVSTIDFNDVIIGVSVPRIVTLENHSSIPACLVLDLKSSLSDEFSIATPTKLLARLDDASSIFTPVIENSHAPPPVAHLEGLGEQDAKPAEPDALCSKWQINLPPNSTVAFHLVFTPRRVGKHSSQFPIQFAGISGGSSSAAAPATIKRQVSARSVAPCLLFSTSVINFNRCVITREGIRKVPYTKQLVLTNHESRTLKWHIDTAKLKLANQSSLGAKRSVTGSASSLIFYVAPDRGELAPEEEVKVRVSFLPADPVEYVEEELPLLVDDEFYLNLTVRGEGIHPHLSFSESKVVLPTVPLGFTARAKVFVQSTGYDHLELTHRVPLDTTKAPLTVHFPKGKVLSMACPTLPIEIRFCSTKSVAFNAQIEFFDADGNAFYLPVAGCTENCLLTNYAFLQSHHLIQRLPVMQGRSANSDGGEPSAPPSAVAFFTHASGRFPVYLLPNAQVSAELESQNHPQQGSQASGYIAVDTSLGLPDDSSVGSVLLKQVLPASATPSISPAFSQAEIDFVLQYINANFLRAPVAKFPHDFADSDGKPLYEMLEMVCTKKPGTAQAGGIPRMNGVSGNANKPAGKSSGVSANQSKRDLVARITTQYAELLKFLKSYGAMLHDVQPEHLLRQDYYVAACEDPRAEPSLLSSPAVASMPFVQRRGILEREWKVVSENAWMKVLYQVIKCFLLYRVTAKAYQQQQQQQQAQLPSRIAQASDGSQQRACQGSNIYSESEMVLVQWVCDHLRSLLHDLNPVPELQLLDVAHDLQDGRFLFHLMAAHIPTLSSDQSDYHGFRIEKRQRPVSANRLHQNAQQLLSVLTLFGVDFGISSGHFLAAMNQREMIVLLLHLYQTLPQFIPKATLEFRGSLGQVIEKSIELKNPGSRPLRYEVFLDDASAPPIDGESSAGLLASAFSIESTQVTLEPGKTISFVVTCRPRFSRKVTARLVFQSVRERDNPSLAAPSGATMVFLLESNILARRPVRVIQIEANTFEKKLEDILIENQFPVNGNYKISMIQSHRQPAHQGVMGTSNTASIAGVNGDDGRSDNTAGAVRGAPGGKATSVTGANRGRKKSMSAQDKALQQKVGAASESQVQSPTIGHDAVPLDGRKARGTGGKTKDDTESLWCMCTQRPFFLPEFGITGDDDQGGRSGASSTAAEGELQATTFGSSVVTIRSQGSSKVKLEFLPLVPGTYKCQLLLLDEKVGEFMYEIQAVAHLPASLETLEFQCEASAGAIGNGAAPRLHFRRDLTVPVKNPLLSRALASLVERANGHMKLKLKDGLKKCEETHHSAFHIEFNSPFFAAAQQELILSTNAQLGRQHSVGGERHSSVGDSALATARTDKLTNDTSGSLNQGGQQGYSAGKAQALKGNQARLSTPRSSVSARNSVLIDFQPKGAGVYTSKLLLRSFNTCCGSSDVRVYDLVAKVKEPNIKTVLEFVAPARHSIVQEIPLLNPSDTPWTLRAAFEKNADAKASMFSGPATLQVPSKRSANYPLSFSPKWISTEKCSFVLVNPATQQQFEFELIGYGEEPLAQDHIVLTCQARTSIVHEFEVLSFKTDPPGEQAFKVESDLRDVVGAPTITAAPARHFTSSTGSLGSAVVAKYPLTFSPVVSGTYFGSITFTNEATKEYVWYTIEANVSPPEPEATLEMRTAVRGAIGVEISLANPLDSPVTFSIELRGQGLLSPSSFALDANASGVYELVYSPLLVTTSASTKSVEEEGAILFSADEIGQFWYRLVLVAEAAPAQEIDDMHCAVGDVCSQPIWLQNPSDQELSLQYRISNTRNFSIKGGGGDAASSPARPSGARSIEGSSSSSTSRAILLPPFAKSSVVVEYTPSSLSDYESASIVFFEPGVVSEWEFAVRGKGKPPSVMKPMDVFAKVGEAASTLFTFKNPFAEPVGVEVKLMLAEDASASPQSGNSRKGTLASVFDMLLKKTHVHLEAFGHLQVPISFLPRAVSEAHAEIIIRGSEAYRELEWHYPIHGVAEAPVHPRPIVLACQARDSVEKKVSLELLAAPTDMHPADEVFSTEWEISSERFGALATAEAIERALTVRPQIRDTDGQSPDSSSTSVVLPYAFRFEPLRPYRGSVYLLVKKKSGGRWRFEVVLDASDPPVDDTITIESSLNQTSSVTFQLRNQFRQSAVFNAEFSAGSSAAFSVYPAEGVLPPFGSNEGQSFVVSFTPTGYGKMQSGQLLIVTEEMQWTFNVKGTYPDASSKGSSSSSGQNSSLSSSASRTRLGISTTSAASQKPRQKKA